MNLCLPVPPAALALLWAPGSGIKGLDAEQGHKGACAEGADCVEVGVIRCPASHDLLIVHQRVTGTAQGAAGQQDLQARRPPQAQEPRFLPPSPAPASDRGKGRGACTCMSKHSCVGGVLLTSREGGCRDPGVSLRRSEEWRRLRLLTEDSERSHSLPREAELCHHRRKGSQPAPRAFSGLSACHQPLPRPPGANASRPSPRWLPRRQWIQDAPGGAGGCPLGCGGLGEAGQGAARVGEHERQGSGGKE